MKTIDTQVVLGLNKLVGLHGALDTALELLASDYFLPAIMALGLVALWFVGRTHAERSPGQRAVITAVIALGLGNLAVLLSNDYYFRPRPFTETDLDLLLYMPTDSSFPANPAVLSFALASSVWPHRRLVACALLLTASLWGLSRVIGGVFYLSDVLAGAAIGVTIALLTAYALRWLEPIPTLAVRTARWLHLA